MVGRSGRNSELKNWLPFSTPIESMKDCLGLFKEGLPIRILIRRQSAERGVARQARAVTDGSPGSSLVNLMRSLRCRTWRCRSAFFDLVGEYATLQSMEFDRKLLISPTKDRLQFSDEDELEMLEGLEAEVGLLGTLRKEVFGDRCENVLPSNTSKLEVS